MAKRVFKYLSLTIISCLIVVSAGMQNAQAADKPLKQLIAEANVQIKAIEAKKKTLKDEWTKNQSLIKDLTDFRDKAQKNTEKGVLTIGARLLKDAAAPLIKNHGYGVINKLTGMEMTPNKQVANTTLQWSKMRDRAVTMIASTQKRQKEILAEIKKHDESIAALKVKIKKWQAEYDAVMGTTPKDTYDYAKALAQWQADYVAGINRTVTDEGWGQTHVYSIEFVVAPHIVMDGSSPGVYGSHKIWDDWSFFKGDYMGQTGRNTVNEFYLDSPVGGQYITLSGLKDKYPQFNVK